MMLMTPFRPEFPDWHGNEPVRSAWANLAHPSDALGLAAAPIGPAFAFPEEWNGYLSGVSWADARQVQSQLQSQSWLATSGCHHLIMIPLALFSCAMLAFLLARLCRVRRARFLLHGLDCAVFPFHKGKPPLLRGAVE